jgi:hypothetical protein
LPSVLLLHVGRSFPQQQSFNIPSSATTCLFSRTATCFVLNTPPSGYQCNVLKNKVECITYGFTIQFFCCVGSQKFTILVIQ